MAANSPKDLNSMRDAGGGPPAGGTASDGDESNMQGRPTWSPQGSGPVSHSTSGPEATSSQGNLSSKDVVLAPCPIDGMPVVWHHDHEADCDGCHHLVCTSCGTWFDLSAKVDRSNNLETLTELQNAIAAHWNAINANETLARHLQPRYVLEQIMNNSTDPWAKGVARTCLMGSSVETFCEHDMQKPNHTLTVTHDMRRDYASVAKCRVCGESWNHPLHPDNQLPKNGKGE